MGAHGVNRNSGSSVAAPTVPGHVSRSGRCTDLRGTNQEAVCSWPAFAMI